MTRLEALSQFGGCRQNPTDTIERLHGCAHLTHCRSLFTIEGTVGLIECRLNLLGMRHGVALLFQFLLFSSHQMRVRQFRILKLQEVSMLAVLFDFLA